MQKAARRRPLTAGLHPEAMAPDRIQAARKPVPGSLQRPDQAQGDVAPHSSGGTCNHLLQQRQRPVMVVFLQKREHVEQPALIGGDARVADAVDVQPLRGVAG